MIVRRLAAVAVFALFAVAFAAPGASARPPDSTTTTLPPTTAPPTTAPPTTLPPTTLPPDSTTTTLGPPDDPAAGSDGASEPVAVVPGTVPSLGLYAGQESLARAIVVRGTLRVVEATAIAATEAYKQAQQSVADLEADYAEVKRRVDALKLVQRVAIRELAEAHEALLERAADAYVRGSLTGPETMLSSSTATEYFNRVMLIDSVLASDQDIISRYETAKDNLRGDLFEMADALYDTHAALDTAKSALAETAKLAAAAAFDLAVFSKGGRISIHGFVFPVDDPHEFVDSYGAPRLLGSVNQHWHEGTDIMAPRGTELFACERGIITKIGANELGGLSLWLKGESGTYYYYAHLEDFADGLAANDLVDPGQVVGFVGNSGDALGGPTHLHFEVHPEGGPAVNPYPLLKVVDDLRGEAIPLPI